MSLTAGTRVGPYDIVAKVGEGGMGEVYRARDPKLQRDVAIKLLPERFASDSDRVARFEREAQLLATLNHPNIATIFGWHELTTDDADVRVCCIALELVDGESLATRLTRGPMSHEDALTVVRQIIDALDAAHERGIIHRDLKPANIMLTADGQVKILDFGLAKAFDSSPTQEAANSPTLTFAATNAGVILGTAAYMAPEQAKGRAADKRCDVWALGCVWYEMLTGTRAFDGEDVTETLAAIVRGEPDWTAVSSKTPPHIVSIIKRCLAKDRRTRIPDASVIRFLLDDERQPQAKEENAVARRHRLVPIVVSFLLTMSAAAVAAAIYFYRQIPASSSTRFLIDPPPGATFMTGLRPASSVAISPDGERLAFTAADASGATMLWVRRIDAFDAQPVPGTKDASFPFWSPDSQFIAFFAGPRLMRVDLAGGLPQTVCTVRAGRGGAWGVGDVIVYAEQGQGLMRVAAAGGEPVDVGAVPQSGVIDRRFPSFLPDGRHVLFYENAGGSERAAGNGVYVMSLADGQTQRVAVAGTGGVYVDGYVLFAREGTLLAQAFDVKSLQTLGETFPVAERVESGVYAGVIGFSASTNGRLAYGMGTPRDSTGQTAVLVVDRSGKTISTLGTGDYVGLDLSPDDTQVVVHRHDEGAGDLWLLGVTTGTTVRFTADGQENSYPVWSPDGKQIAYTSRVGAHWSLWTKPTDMTGEAVRVLDDPSLGSAPAPSHWLRDGTGVLYTRLDPSRAPSTGGAAADVWLLPVQGDRKARPVLNSSFTDTQASVSPDGRWIAYQSNSNGRAEVYVRPFPSGPGLYPVSTGGGTRPRWRSDGRELYFISGGAPGDFMAVQVHGDRQPIEFAKPVSLFPSGLTNATHPPHLAYAVFRDGQRFVIARGAENRATSSRFPLAVVTNWTAGLRR